MACPVSDSWQPTGVQGTGAQPHALFKGAPHDAQALFLSVGRTPAAVPYVVVFVLEARRCNEEVRRRFQLAEGENVEIDVRGMAQAKLTVVERDTTANGPKVAWTWLPTPPVERGYATLRQLAPAGTRTRVPFGADRVTVVTSTGFQWNYPIVGGTFSNVPGQGTAGDVAPVEAPYFTSSVAAQLIWRIAL